GTGKVDVENLTITKYIDKSTPVLKKYLAKGTAYKTATLYIRKAGDKPIDYVKLELHNGLISQLAVGGGGGDDRFTENLSLNFASFKYTYTPQDAKGAATAEIPASWNIAKNTESVP
ncbi:MAG: type VI secretion system tube protein Hcp, partial [Polyangiales bacterium]